MAKGSIRHPPFDIGHDRERRVHQHHRRHGVRGQVIVDLAASNRVTGRAGKREERRSARVSASSLRISEPPTACARIAISRCRPRVPAPRHQPDPGRRQRSKAERQRRAELLEALAFVGATGLRGQQPRDLLQQREPGNRRGGFAEKRLSVFAQEQHRGDFAGLVGQLPVPGTTGVGRTESGFHGAAQDRSIER